MFGPKLNEDHKFLIDALAKETKQSKDDVLYYVLEMGFINLRLGTEENEKIIQSFDMVKKDTTFMSIAKLLRNWWNQGQKG